MKDKSIDLLNCTIRVIKDEEYAMHLVSVYPRDEDPTVYSQQLKYHVLCGFHPTNPTIPQEKLLGILSGYDAVYRDLIEIASTPLPFPLIQMGRTFLFLWTFSFPFLLNSMTDKLFNSVPTVFFLTYGFLGLEVATMTLANPFGDGTHDIHITGMREATVAAINKDYDRLDDGWGGGESGNNVKNSGKNNLQMRGYDNKQRTAEETEASYHAFVDA